MPVTFRGTPGDPAAQQRANLDTFAQMLTACIGRRVTIDAAGRMSRAPGDPASLEEPLVDILDNLIDADENLVITVGRNNAVIDNYAARAIDLDDIEQFPERPPPGQPSATTRCEVLIHVLAEYKYAMHEGNLTGPAGFREAHERGCEAQSEWRESHDQRGECHGNVWVPPSTIETRYCDGSRTRITVDGSGAITGITNLPAPPGGEPAGGRCFITTAAFGSDAEAVLRPLHTFRDEVVRQTRWGRRLFEDWDRLYYRFSPAIAAQMHQDPEVRDLVKTIVVQPWVNYVELALARPSDWSPRPDNEALGEFLRRARRGLDEWAAVVPLPEDFDGLSHEAVVDELSLLLELVLTGHEDDYLARLVDVGALPLLCDPEEAKRLRERLRQRGRPDSEVSLIVADRGAER